MLGRYFNQGEVFLSDFRARTGGSPQTQQPGVSFSSRVCNNLLVNSEVRHLDSDLDWPMYEGWAQVVYSCLELDLWLYQCVVDLRYLLCSGLPGGNNTPDRNRARQGRLVKEADWVREARVNEFIPDVTMKKWTWLLGVCLCVKDASTWHFI